MTGKEKPKGQEHEKVIVPKHPKIEAAEQARGAVQATLEKVGHVEGKWETGKKDPSLPDNPTHEQLKAAGYKQYSVTIPSHYPPMGRYGSGIPRKNRMIAEVKQGTKKMDEAAANALFSFRATDKSGYNEIKSVFVKGTLTDKGLETANRPSLKKTLSGKIKGVTFEDVENKPENLKNKEVFTITIKNRKEFLKEANLRKLIPYFGLMVFSAFEERGENIVPKLNLPNEKSTKQFVDDFFREGDLGSTDKIYVMGNGENVEGFYFLKNCELKNGDKVDHILLTSMDRPYQGKGGFKQLTKTVFDNEKVSGFTALSHTPELVKSFIKQGKGENMDVFFCGKKDADANIPLTAEDKKTLELFQGDIDRQVHEYEFDDLQKGLPKEYISYGTGSIPPRRMDEVKLPENDPVRKTFADMIGFGDKNKPGEALYGALFVKRRKA